MSDVSIPRESVEFVPVTVKVDGVVVTVGVEIAVTTDGVRPTTYTAATVLGGKTGVVLPAVAFPGKYRIWPRVASSPETVVVDGLLVRRT